MEIAAASLSDSAAEIEAATTLAFISESLFVAVMVTSDAEFNVLRAA